MAKPLNNEETQLDRFGRMPTRRIMDLGADDIKARELGVRATDRLLKRIKEGKETPIEKVRREQKQETAGWAEVQSWDPDLKRGRNPKKPVASPGLIK